MENQIRAGIFGLLVGDALGVPVEFKSRESLKQNPVTDMRGFGTHNQPPGTWSDDGSMALCILDGISDGVYNIKKIAVNFLSWYENADFTPYNEIFDMGNTTSEALNNLSRTRNYKTCGFTDVNSNGNGSLMRCLPLVFVIKDLSIEERFEIIREVSAVTHGHPLSIICNFYYLEFARLLLQGKDKFESYNETISKITPFLAQGGGYEIVNLIHLFKSNDLDLINQEYTSNITIPSMMEKDISSSGYVLHTLEAAIWCLMTSNTFEETVLKAVNLGEDTDTTGAVAGGLAGLLYGYYNIPSEWLHVLPKLTEINTMITTLANNL